MDDVGDEADACRTTKPVVARLVHAVAPKRRLADNNTVSMETTILVLAKTRACFILKTRWQQVEVQELIVNDRLVAKNIEMSHRFCIFAVFYDNSKSSPLCLCLPVVWARVLYL